MKQIPAEPSS
jgi:hypothetical protein